MYCDDAWKNISSFEISWKYFVASLARHSERQECNLGCFDSGARWKIGRLPKTRTRKFSFHSIKSWMNWKHAIMIDQHYMHTFPPSLGHVASQWRNQNYLSVLLCRLCRVWVLNFPSLSCRHRLLLCSFLGARNFTRIMCITSHSFDNKKSIQVEDIIVIVARDKKKSNRDEKKENVKKIN